jgi:transglutaminase-like putative cysteine protease
MAEYEITHTTEYNYSENVSHCQNIAYLLPQSDARQTCEKTEITISPQPATSAHHTDYYGNHFLYFAVEQPHRQLSVTAKTRIRTCAPCESNEENSLPWDILAQNLRNPTEAFDIAAVEYLLPSPFVPLSEAFAEYAAASFSPNRPVVLAAALDLVQRIRKDFKYEQKSTTILTPLTEVFRLRRGVCQDFAHLAIAALRSIGIPARYVSGYIETYPPAGKPKLRGSDASHAWISVYAGNGCWYDYDPTNGKAITEEFIVTAHGRDFGDVSPLKGILFGDGKHSLKVAVDVHRIA